MSEHEHIDISHFINKDEKYLRKFQTFLTVKIILRTTVFLTGCKDKGLF